MDFVPEDYRILTHYLNQYHSQKPAEKPSDISSPKFLFRRINKNASNLGDTVLSEYPSNQNKEPSSSNSNHENDPSEEHKSGEDKLKLSEFAALMTKREQEVFKPIYFNVLIVGESALGKSTFIEALLDKVA